MILLGAQHIFQFQHGAIKANLVFDEEWAIVLFQFQHGAIKAPLGYEYKYAQNQHDSKGRGEIFWLKSRRSPMIGFYPGIDDTCKSIHYNFSGNLWHLFEA